MPNPEKKELTGQLGAADVLIIVPPVAQVTVPSLAAHLLQAYCRRSGINVRVFYGNLHFSSLIGFSLYRTIAELNSINFIGERLFTASAFGLPPMGRNIHRLIDPEWLPDHIWQRKNEIATEKMSEHLAPIRKWILSMDWQQVENQVTQWTVSTAKQIVGMGYGVVGCTNTLGGLVPAIALLNHVKQANPNIITVLGGALCEGEMAEGILSLNTAVDYVFSGESDNTFPAFVQDILADKRPERQIIIGKEIEELDEIPLPDYGEFFRQAESVSLKPPYADSFIVLYETSRGCRWNKCTFCGLTGKRKYHRFKSPGKVLEDLKQMVNQYPENPIHMADNLMPVQYFKTLFPRIAQEFPSIHIRYEVNSGLTLDQVIALKQAGITCIMPGIETFSPTLLKRIRKKGTIRQNIELLRYSRSVGIDVRWHLLYGIPGDQMSEYEEMLELILLIRHLQPPLRLIPIEIPRFSLYQRMPEDYGISDLRPAALYEDVLPSHADLEKIAYLFAGDFESPAYEHPDILTRLRQEFQQWVNTWKTYDGDPLHPQLPKLSLERLPTRDFVLHDTRGLAGRPETMVLDRDKARVLLAARPWDDSPQLRWAVDTKLAILKESWVLPLATADPEIILGFEREYNQ